MCFSAENFNNKDQLIRFYTGIVNWAVFYSCLTLMSVDVRI